jgi:adenylate cyclase
VHVMSVPGVRPSDQAALAQSSIRRSRRALAAVIVVGIVAAVLAWRVRSASVEVRPIRSIAVLPLQNLSGDPEQEYFSDGTTEALISRLAQIRAVDVISRTSIMRYKGTTKSLQEIGRELRVDAIVEGSVQRAGGRVRVTAEVIRVSTDKHLWAGTYERDQADILKLEADAAVAIAQQIVAHVTPEEGHRLASAPRVHPTAHEEYLLGEHSLLPPGPSDLATSRQAVAHFTRAIDFQPDYADAFAGLAIARQNLGQLDAARTAAETALRFDPDLSEAHTAIAGIMTAKYDWRGAEREYQRALDLNPNTLTACVCYSVFLRMTGRFAQAFALIQRTAAMDPLSSAVQAEYGTVLFMWRKYDEAIPHLERAIELDARNRFASYALSLTYEMLRRPEQSLALLDRPEFRPSAELGLAYASLGRRSDALKMISDLEKKGVEPDGVTVALIFFTLRDTDRGFQWLTRAFDERQGRANFVKFHPMFDTVRSDPRFTALMARLNLPDP